MPGHQPKLDDFVDEIVGDAKTPPSTLLLAGFVGKAAEDDHTRLYLNPELGEYIDIPNDAILHSKAIPKDSSPLGGSFVWIERDAELIRGASKFEAIQLEIVQRGGFTAWPACGVHYTSLGECNKSYVPCAIPSIDVACHTPPGRAPYYCRRTA